MREILPTRLSFLKMFKKDFCCFKVSVLFYFYVSNEAKRRRSYTDSKLDRQIFIFALGILFGYFKFSNNFYLPMSNKKLIFHQKLIFKANLKLNF